MLKKNLILLLKDLKSKKDYKLMLEQNLIPFLKVKTKLKLINFY